MDINSVLQQIIEPTSLYYTYSTIAQTLATAFGILGAFMLFKIQDIERSLKGLSVKLYEGREKKTDTIDKEYCQEHWGRLSKLLIKKKYSDLYTENGSISEVQFGRYKDALEDRIGYKRKVINKLKGTLTLTAITIAVSLLLLPLSSLLSAYLYYGLGILVLLLLLSFACLYKYVDLIMKALGYKKMA